MLQVEQAVRRVDHREPLRIVIPPVLWAVALVDAVGALQVGAALVAIQVLVGMVVAIQVARGQEALLLVVVDVLQALVVVGVLDYLVKVLVACETPQ